jgi:RHS repeat-associated protein
MKPTKRQSQRATGSIWRRPSGCGRSSAVSSGIPRASGPVGHSSTLNADFTPGAYEYDFEYRYAGYRWDYETHLLQVRNRWYHPKLGRWVSRDPIGYAGGTWNLYEYVAGGPLVAIDPFGLKSVKELPSAPEGLKDLGIYNFLDEPLLKMFDKSDYQYVGFGGEERMQDVLTYVKQTESGTVFTLEGSLEVTGRLRHNR